MSKIVATAEWERGEGSGLICPHCGGVVDACQLGMTQWKVAPLYCLSCLKPLLHPDSEGDMENGD